MKLLFNINNRHKEYILIQDQTSLDRQFNYSFAQGSFNMPSILSNNEWHTSSLDCKHDEQWSST